jgi:glyoxylase-like metal-dependent hydrolase (beta-lactamase superfamily II)
MAAEHAGLIASRRRQPEIAALFEDTEAYEPSRTFETEMTLDLGGTQVRILHSGHNHTPGDAVVHVPAESVVFCGDLVSNDYHVNYEDAAVENLESGLDFLRSLRARTYVPGHGSPGGPEILDAQSRYHEKVREAAQSLDSEEAAERIRAAFPSYQLAEVVGSFRK